jgi:hypothetical protein
MGKEQILDDLLGSLKDGGWHSVKELMSIISPLKLERALVFLEQYDFIQWDKKHGRVRLDYGVLNFLQRLFEVKTSGHQDVKTERWKKRCRH